MSTKTASRQNIPSQPSVIVPQFLVSLAAGVALFIALLAMLLTGYDYVYAGKIYPGVFVGGVDLSGLAPEQAEALLSQQISYPKTGKLVFQNGETVWLARPLDLGMQFDAANSARAAYELGRSRDPITDTFNKVMAWYSGRRLPPLMLYDERQASAFLTNLAAQIDQPTVEASLQINGTDVVVRPGQVGRLVNVSASLAPLAEQLRGMSDGVLPLEIEESPPVIVDVSQQAQIARQILSAPLVISIPDALEGDPGPWTIEPPQLAQMLTIERVDDAQQPYYQVGLATGQLRALLAEQQPVLRRFASNPRVMFNDETRQLELLKPAVIGRDLDIEASLQQINDKLAQGEHAASLVFNYTQPQVASDATAEQLGITELVSSHTSYFRGSGASRIQNIETAAANFHGLLVPPGATFSMADAMGDVSLDSGYAEALIIFGGRTIKGVGGGVCQVSTTLFRTAFLGGFPIVERYPHAYRVGYYEQTVNGLDPDLAGLDATVFVPMVDFKFVNDSQHWLLMETYVNAKAGRLTWKFYSTSDGRVVDWSTTGPQNIVEPPEPLYEENPELGTGEIKQVDYAAQGADVTVYRTVRIGDQVLFQDEFSTHYLPWRDIYQYGPGTDVPEHD